MFRTIFYHTNIICKVLFLLLMMFCIYFLKNIYVIFVILLYFNILFRNKRYLCLSLVLFTLTVFFPVYRGLTKFYLCMSLMYIFLKYINIDSVRYFFEVLFYRNQSNKFLYFILSICYFCKFYINNFKAYYELASSYGIKRNFDYYKYIFSNSYKKTCDDIGEYMLVYKKRFYNIYNKRTYLESYSLSSGDVKVVLFGSIVLFFVLVFGR